MPDKELEQFVSQVDALASKLKSCSAGPDAGTLAVEYAQVIVSTQLRDDATEAQNKIETVSIELQPKAMCVNWPKLFETAIEGHYTSATIRLVLDLMWIIGGPRAVSAFFSMKPTQEYTCKSLSESLMKLDPTELGSKYHLPVIIDRMSPPEPLNYEPVAELLLHSLQLVGSLAQDPLVLSLVLVHAAKMGEKAVSDKELAVLQDSAKYVLSGNVKFMDLVFAKVAKSPRLALSVFEKVKNSDDFVSQIASTYSAVLLQTWSEHDSHYRDVIDVLVRADLIAPVPVWASFLTKFVGSNAKAFGVLLDYMTDYLAQTAPNTANGNVGPGDNGNNAGNVRQKLSLRIVSAVAMLTQTSEVPTDKSDRQDQIQALQLQLLHDYPRLINYGEGHDEAIMENSNLPAFSPDIEAEMKLCFEKMYEQQHDIQEVISMLERLKQSEIPRDQDLFACMIHSLFDEYRFFPQYPVKALATTAVLFGSLVHFRLIEGIPLVVALKFILDALHQDPDSNMFRFGLQALVELRLRLPEMPKYCKVLLTIPGLQRHQHFHEQIKSIAQPVPGENDGFPLFRSILDSPLEESSLESYGNAARQVSEKARLIINNLTSKNLHQKADDLIKELSNLSPVQFARFIVSRASNEHNNHPLYSQLLNILPPEIKICCVDAIVAAVAAIFNGQDTLSVENRTAVKGLGQFLGMITLECNRPLLFQQLHLKLLLAEAVRYEKLPVVLPFVARVLAQTAKSKAFVKTNPWVAALLAVLSELYHFGSLPLTLKFEIEVLGNAIHTRVESIEPAVYIRDEVKQQEDAASITATRGGPAVLNSLPIITAPQQSIQQGTGLRGGIPPGVVPSAAGIPPGFTPFPSAINGGNSQLPTSAVAAAAAAAAAAGGNAFVGGIPPGQLPPATAAAATAGGIPGAVPQSIGQVAPGVPLVGTTDFVNHPGLRQLLDLARSKTLQDVLLPVIDRSVSIACFTTKELVLKDFANEPDEGKLQAAAHAPALALASSMAIVTAKEPFIEALAHNLRALMVNQGYGEAQVLLEQINVAARETMESLVPLVESVAREKAIVEIDEALMPEYKIRQQTRSMGRPFKAEGSQKLPFKLPDGLAIRKDGLTEEQMGVYEQFALQSYGGGASLDPLAGPYGVNAGGIGGVSTHGLTAELQKFTEEIGRLELLTKSSQKRLGDHNKDDEVLQLLSKITSIIRNGSKMSEEVPLRASHLVVHALFGPESTNSALYRESLCYLLGELCRMSGLTAKEVVLWLLYADDSKKFNANVIGTLLRGRLVTPTEIDASLTKDISDAATKPEVVDYAVRLLLDALVGPEPYCLRSDFAGTILALSKLDVQQFPAADILIQTLQETRGHGNGNEGHIFAEWTRLMQHHATANSPALLHAFVRDLHDLGWGSNPEQLMYFVRTAVTVSLKSFNQSKSFVGVDAISVLITTLLKTVRENKQLASSIFTTIALLIAKDHEAGAFEPLPYFRLLSSIACTLPEVYLPNFCEMLITLQPIAFPGFASCWITLASHRFVMGRLLPNKSEWHLLYDLVSGLLNFSRQVWLSSVMDTAIRGFIFRALERIFLVILNDEPGFFIRYSDNITAVLVSEFVQLRNIVLCAFPEGQELPNPVSDAPVEYYDACSEMAEAVEESRKLLTERNVVKLIENACQPRSQLTPQIVLAIQTALSFSKPLEDRGIDFDSIGVSMLGYNAFATYVAHLYTQYPPASGNVEDSSAAQLCGRMLLTLSRENRYAFTSAIVNHLRYPEKHTFFFKGFLLALFTTFGERMFKDGIVEARHVVTRVLLERLMAHRPHPWGLMHMFSELLKSEKYNFQEMPFVKSSPDVAVLFSTLYSHISRPEVSA